MTTFFFLESKVREPNPLSFYITNNITKLLLGLTYSKMIPKCSTKLKPNAKIEMHHNKYSPTKGLLGWPEPWGKMDFLFMSVPVLSSKNFSTRNYYLSIFCFCLILSRHRYYHKYWKHFPVFSPLFLDGKEHFILDGSYWILVMPYLWWMLLVLVLWHAFIPKVCQPLHETKKNTDAITNAKASSPKLEEDSITKIMKSNLIWSLKGLRFLRFW